MQIAALQNFSLLDYPGKISALVFTQGCNFKCKFCYNPELIKSEIRNPKSEILEIGVIDFLKSRIGKLDAAVITGGEPTINKDLPRFIKEIKDLGLLVGLYTNGSNPRMLRELVDKELVDYISMDVKTKLDHESYQRLTDIDIDLDKIRESIKIIREPGSNYTFRTTMVPGLVSFQDVEQLASEIKGAKKFIIQQFVNNVEIVDNRYRDARLYSADELGKLRDRVSQYFEKCEIRA